MTTVTRRVIRDPDTNMIAGIEEPDRLGDIATQLRDLRHRIDGWTPGADNLEINVRAVEQVARELGLKWKSTSDG